LLSFYYPFIACTSTIHAQASVFELAVSHLFCAVRLCIIKTYRDSPGCLVASKTFLINRVFEKEVKNDKNDQHYQYNQ
jgi:hypothetical protein